MYLVTCNLRCGVTAVTAVQCGRDDEGLVEVGHCLHMRYVNDNGTNELTPLSTEQRAVPLPRCSRAPSGGSLFPSDACSATWHSSSESASVSVRHTGRHLQCHRRGSANAPGGLTVSFGALSGRFPSPVTRRRVEFHACVWRLLRNSISDRSWMLWDCHGDLIEAGGANKCRGAAEARVAQLFLPDGDDDDDGAATAA